MGSPGVLARRLQTALVTIWLAPGGTLADGGHPAVDQVPLPSERATTTYFQRRHDLPAPQNKDATLALQEIVGDATCGPLLYPGSVFAYVLSGSVSVEVQRGLRGAYAEGEAFYVQPMHVVSISSREHRAAKVLLFCVTAGSEPLTRPASAIPQ